MQYTLKLVLDHMFEGGCLFEGEHLIMEMRSTTYKHCIFNLPQGDLSNTLALSAKCVCLQEVQSCMIGTLSGNN